MEICVARIDEDRTFSDVFELMALSRVSDIAVTGKDNSFKGVVSAGDLMREVFPDFLNVIKDHASLDDAYMHFHQRSRSIKDMPLSMALVKPSFTASPEDNVLDATKVMIEKVIRQLPVVENGKLVGSISRENICFNLLNR